LAVEVATRPKSFGVTSVSMVSTTSRVLLIFFASLNLISISGLKKDIFFSSFAPSSPSSFSSSTLSSSSSSSSSV